MWNALNLKPGELCLPSSTPVDPKGDVSQKGCVSYTCLPAPLTPAHETQNDAIRNAAIRLLLEAENPGVVVDPEVKAAALGMLGGVA